MAHPENSVTALKGFFIRTGRIILTIKTPLGAELSCFCELIDLPRGIFVIVNL